MQPTDPSSFARSPGSTTEADYQALLAAFAQAFWETDATGSVVTDSPSWRAYTGQTLEQWLSEGWINAVHPDDRTHALEQWRQAVVAQLPVSSEFRLWWVGGGGGWRWTSVQAVAIRHADGSIKKWIGINIDIEAKKQADQALHESEQRKSFLLKLSDALNALPDPVEVQQQALTMVGEYLNLDRVLYAEMDPAGTESIVLVNHVRAGLAPHIGRFSTASVTKLIRELQAGKPVVICDIEAEQRFSDENRAYYRRFQVAALAVVPLVKRGQWLANLTAHCRQPRQWTQHDIWTLEETAERTWVAIERARAAEALRDKEERLRTLIYNLPDYAIFRLDAAGLIVEWTNGAEQVTGYAAHEAIGHHLALFYLPAAVATGEVDNELTNAAHLGRSEQEGPRLRKNGDLFFVNEIATAIYDGQGQLTGFTKISRDITARKAEQERLRILEERTLIAVEAADMGTWEWHLLTNEVYWNEQHFWLFGMPPQPQPLTPDAISQQVHPDDRAYVTAELNRSIRDRTTYDTEFRARRDDTGKLVWMSGYGRITAEIDGQASRMNGVMFDITERRQALEALRESRQRLQIILDSIADHIIITFDSETIITSWNGGAEQIFGYSAEEAIGQSMQLIFTPEDRITGELEKEMTLARRNGQIPDERDHLLRNGSRLYISGVLSPLYDDEGQLLGYVKVARDLSERRRMEQTLRETDRRKDEFLAMLAHELRNPLAPIRSGLQLLSLTSADDPTFGPLLPIMNRQMDHLVRLVDDLLDVSRISKGKIELRKEWLNLTQIVGQAVDAMQPLYASAGRQLSSQLPNRALYLNGDATRLNQMVTNLLTNGIRYTYPNGRAWLSLEPPGEDGEAVLRVRDNGIGLAPDQLKSIFELFVQVDTSLDRSNGGLGLGLTLVQQLVEMHGGRVKATSPGLGQGSEFAVYLPVSTSEIRT